MARRALGLRPNRLLIDHRAIRRRVWWVHQTRIQLPLWPQWSRVVGRIRGRHPRGGWLRPGSARYAAAARQYRRALDDARPEV